MEEITVKDLLESNGQDGAKVYVAWEGKVYDVTGSRLWAGGVHMGRHHAGRDLTTDIGAAPHSPDVLARYPQVGVLKSEKIVPETAPGALLRLLTRFPVLRRHPHPMTVHFPIVFMVSAAMFTFLYLLTGVPGFDQTALNCLGAGLFFTPVAIGTGFYTWWLNYMAGPIRAVTIKQRLSVILLCVNLIVFVWRIKVPDILSSFGPLNLLYLVLILSLLFLVTVIGWLGATLTFPVEKE